MSDFGIGPVGSANPALPVTGPAPAATGVEFGEALRRALAPVNELQQAADRASQEFALGHSQDVASTLIAIEKANLAFQFALQIRNKLLETYQEIMRMPL
jgi:flagellar hook-basal body complex protein FliE